MSFLQAVAQACATPHIQEIKWPDFLDAAHPIRDVLTHIRLWDSPVSAALQEKIDAAKKASPDKPEWISATFWYVIAAALVNTQGDLLCATTEFETVAEELKLAHSNPLSMRIFDPLWSQIMEFNGWMVTKEAAAAKNSETTGISVAS